MTTLPSLEPLLAPPPKSSHAGHWEEATSPIEDLRRRPAVTESSAVFSRSSSK